METGRRLRFLLYMHKLLDTSTAAIPTGVPPQSKLLLVENGVYAGRLFALFNVSSSAIAYSYSDPPYTIWSAPYNHITDAADYPVSACIDSAGNIYVVYIQQTTLNVIFFRLPFSGGLWASGAPYTVIDSGLAYYPVIARNNDGDLWCAFAYYNSSTGKYTVRVKYSTDDGQTWDTDPGTAISAECDEMPYAGLAFAGSSLYAVFTENRSNLYLRKYISGWDTALLVYSGDYIDADFALAVADDLTLGIMFVPSEAGFVYYRQFDGVTLGGLQEVFEGQAVSPQLIFRNSKPYLFFAEALGNDSYHPRYAIKENDDFTSAPLIHGLGCFDYLLLYNQSSQTYEDKTAAAGSTDTGDVFHSYSNALLSAVGDCLYLGHNEKYFCVLQLLFISSSGGGVIWEYFNGTSWISFTPVSGPLGFAEISAITYLWDDIQSAPDDWQVGSINSISAYWVRARVTANFTVPPVGTQLTAAAKCKYLALARGSR